MIRCILYPGCKLFVTSGGKEQAAGIIKEKVTEICSLVPAFERELDRRPGKTRESKDYCIYMFKNGSYFDNIAARESSRGKRRHGKNFFYDAYLGNFYWENLIKIQLITIIPLN